MNQAHRTFPAGQEGGTRHKAKGRGLKSMRGLCVLRTTPGRAECAGPYKRNTYIYQIHTWTTGDKERGQPCTRRRSASSCRAARQASGDAYKACTVAAPLRARASEGLQALHQPGGCAATAARIARPWLVAGHPPLCGCAPATVCARDTHRTTYAPGAVGPPLGNYMPQRAWTLVSAQRLAH